MLLTRFLGYFARVAAPTTPAKIRFALHDQPGGLNRLAEVMSVEFSVDDATWTVNLKPGQLIPKTVPRPPTPAAPFTPGEKPH